MFVLYNEVHYKEAIAKAIVNSKIYDHVENIVIRKQSTAVEVVDMKTLDAVVLNSCWIFWKRKNVIR